MADNNTNKSFLDTFTDTITAYSMKVAELSVRLIKGESKGIAKEAVDALFEKLGDVESERWLTMLSAYEGAGIITDKDAVQYYKLKDLAHPFDWIMYFVTTAKLFFNFVTVHNEANMAKQSQAINADRRPYLPSYNDIINAAFIAPEKTGRVRDIMKKTGLQDEDIDLVFLSKYALYPVEVVKTLYLRGIITKEIMYERMRELGFTDRRIQEIIQSWEIIPGPQDLLWMVGKEAFEPDIINMVGLDEEFPADQVEWLQKQGLSSFWAHKYWYAHWDQPSIQQGYEMLHRGVIGDAELEVLFKAIEIPPFWRDKLRKISYRPYSRVDVRRMHALGVIDDQELIQAYKDLGYDDDKALKMSQFTVLYNQGSGSKLTKSQLLSSYKDGMLKRQDAKDLLIGIDLSEDEAEFLLYHEDFKKDKQITDATVKNIGDRYKLNLIEEIDVRSQLGKLNLLSDKIETLISAWQIDKFENMKLPSKTDLDKFYRNKIINKDTYYMEMRKLGYTAIAVDWYLKLVELTMGANKNE